MTTLLSVTTFLVMSSLVFLVYRGAAMKQAAEVVCELIDREYIDSGAEKTRAWIEDCRRNSSRGVGPFTEKRLLIEQINERLSYFRISHLEAFAPEQTTSVWTGESVDTGARARLIDGEIVVVRTIPGAPAPEAGVHQGDLIIAINGSPVGQPEEIESRAGIWEVLRADGTRIQLSVGAAAVVDPIEPHFTANRVLRIPTFLPDGFTDEVIGALADRVAEADRLVLDLRKNSGGSFPAMLRAAGLFLCDSPKIGALLGAKMAAHGGRPELTDPRYLLENDLNADIQLERLRRDGLIGLKVFSQSRCFHGPLAILIDEGTASAAEIFVQAMKDRPETFVLGWASAGKVVMARWFTIEPLGIDYTISIPIGLFRSTKGEVLERKGVSPDELLSDDLHEWRSGRDPWIRAALSRLGILAVSQ